MFFLKRLFGRRIRYKKYKRRFLPMSDAPYKIRSWVNRANAEQRLVYFERERYQLDTVINIYNKALSVFNFTRDAQGDYWATPRQVLKNVEEDGILDDDCDGFAVYVYTKLLQNGLPMETVGMVLVEGHMFCCFHSPKIKKDFYVLDNGYMVPERKIVRASRLFPVWKKDKYGEDIKLVPLIGFNRTSWWEYRG